VILCEAAKCAVTSRANVSNIAPPGEVQAVNEHKATAEIREVTGVDGDEARAAARKAVIETGGRIEQRRHRSGLAAGRTRIRHREVWWVPRAAVRG
jgi:hypothetical protein